MNIEVGLLIALCGFILSLVIALKNSTRNTQEDSTKEGYQLGILTQKLTNIDNRLEKIEKRLDNYSRDIEKVVKEEMEKHILEYHKGGTK